MTPAVDWNRDDRSELALLVRATRDRHLVTYRGDPRRVREDHVREAETTEAAYRKRQVIELVQNGADAMPSDTRGRIHVVVTPDALYCANEGLPLTPAGLEEGLLYSGLSPKRSKEIGRFGVGFKSVLAVTSQPLFLSRSISIAFSEEKSRVSIEEATGRVFPGVPVLRLAEPIDPFAVAESDPVVRGMLDWAATIVVLRIDRPDVTWLSASLTNDEFRREFLLFSPQVSKLCLEDRCTGTTRTIESPPRGDDTELIEGDMSASWTVRRWTVQPSDAARVDGGEYFGRPEIDVAWAVPRTTESLQRTGELWSFFPIASTGSSLPGILNSGWKLSTDRNSLVKGELNEELLGSVAEHLVESLPEIADPERPGVALDLVPLRGSPFGETWAPQYVRRRIWELVLDSEIVPSAAGTWRRASVLRIWPSEVRSRGLRELRRRWLNGVLEPAQWVHETALTDDRVTLLEQLGAKTRPLQEWLEAMTGDETREERAVASLEVATGVFAASDVATRDSVRSQLAAARIVLTEGGTWEALGKVDVDRGADDSLLRPHPRIAAVFEALRADLGIQADIRERRLLALARGNPARPDELWRVIHELDAEVVLGLLSKADLLPGVPVRTIAGTFAMRDKVLRPGPVMNPLHDGGFVVDTAFHADDEVLLRAIGVEDRPRLVSHKTDVFMKGQLAAYEQEFTQAYRSRQTELGRSTPQASYVHLACAGSASLIPSHLDVLVALGPEGRERFTSILTSDERWADEWVAYHATQRGSYEDLPIWSPTSWCIWRWGAIQTTLGVATLPLAVSSRLSRWSRFLHVAQCAADIAEALDLPVGLDEIEESGVRQGAIERAAHLADTDVSLAPEAVAFLRAASEAGWAPPDWGNQAPEVGTSRSQVLARRSAGHRTWLCSVGDLGDWAGRWAIAETPAPSAEPAGIVEEYSLAEYMPSIVSAIGWEKAASTFVYECERVLADGEALSFGRGPLGLYVSRGQRWVDCAAWIIDEMCPGLGAAERAALIAGEVAAECEQILERTRSAQDDPERLVAVLGAEGLRRAGHLLPDLAVTADPTALAQGLLTVYGSACLREVAHVLPPGLGVPRQWAGGRLAAEFVAKLGFSQRFAGRPAADLPNAEVVDGPVRLGELHAFQREIATSLYEILVSHGSGVIDLPTGAGKTRVAIEAIIDWTLGRQHFGNVLWVAEREELCEQAVVHWAQLWRAKGLPSSRLRIHRFWGGRHLRHDEDDNLGWVVVASRQQLHGRLASTEVSSLRRAEVLVVDEAHHSTAPTYVAIKAWMTGIEDPRAFACVGLSATPFRSDVERSDHLARLFGRSLVTGALMGEQWKGRVRWLQEHRYLSVIDRRDLDLGVVSLTPDEEAYLLAEPNLDTGIDRLNRRLGDDDHRSRRLIDQVIDMDPDWPVIVFAASVPHAQRLAIMLTELGVTARPIWADLARWARRDAIEQFRARDVRVLTNYNVLAEGFDAPGTRAIVIGRLVRSDGLFLQMLGRGMRGPENGGTERCLLVTTGERLPERFDQDGNLDVDRYEWLWTTR